MPSFSGRGFRLISKPFTRSHRYICNQINTNLRVNSEGVWHWGKYKTGTCRDERWHPPHIRSWEMTEKRVTCTLVDIKQRYPLNKSKILFNILRDKPQDSWMWACVCVLVINPVLVERGGDALRLYFPLMRSWQLRFIPPHPSLSPPPAPSLLLFFRSSLPLIALSFIALSALLVHHFAALHVPVILKLTSSESIPDRRPLLSQPIARHKPSSSINLSSSLPPTPSLFAGSPSPAGD